MNTVLMVFYIALAVNVIVFMHFTAIYKREQRRERRLRQEVDAAKNAHDWHTARLLLRDLHRYQL